MRKIFPFSFFGKNFKSVILSSVVYTLFIVAAAIIVFVTRFFSLEKSRGGFREKRKEKSEERRVQKEKSLTCVRDFSFWCGKRDLNPYGVNHTPLKRARLPVPPLPRIAHSCAQQILLYTFFRKSQYLF